MDPSISFLLLFLAAWILGAIGAFSRRRATRRWCFRALGAISVLNLLFGAMVNWTFRDGMGPDAITSEGIEAFRRASEGYWLVVMLIVLPVLFAWIIARFRPHENGA